MDARIQKILNRMAVCETSYLVAALHCELKELARLSRFCGCTRMTPQPGLSMLVTRKNEMAKAIGRIKSTDRLPWVTQPASNLNVALNQLEVIEYRFRQRPSVECVCMSQ